MIWKQFLDTNKVAATFSFCVFFVGLVLVFVAPSSAQDFRVVAITGQDASQAGVGAIFGPNNALDPGFFAPVINSHGEIAFRGTLRNPNNSGGRNQSIWQESFGALRLLAHQDLPAPIPGDFVWGNDLADPSINNQGQVAFNGTFSPNLPNSSQSFATWSESTGSLSQIVVVGDQVPQIGIIQSLGDVRAHENGITTQQVISGQSTGFHLLRSLPNGTIDRIAGTDDILPDGSGATINRFFGYGANQLGDVVFKAELDNANFYEDEAIVKVLNGQITVVVRENQLMPGTSSKFNIIADSVINAGGNVVFRADSGLFDGDSLERIVGSGDAAPVANGTATFSSMTFGSPRALADKDQLLTFSAVLNDGRRGFWKNTNGVTELIYSDDQPIPGLNDPSANFFAINQADRVHNTDGGFAFFSPYDSGSTTGFGIWATDINDNLQLVVKTGDVIDVGMGDFRTVSELLLGENSFNEKGKIVFQASFTDGTDAILTTQSVPEPASGLLVAGLLVGVFCRRRRTQ